MRKTLLTVAIVLASSSAIASSIEIIGHDRTGNGSVISVTCAACPPSSAEKKAVVAMPALATGTQDVSIRDVDGKRQIVRTEAWLGGSPVTYISNNKAWFPADDTETATTIDTQAKTSAIGNAVAKEASASSSTDAPTPVLFDGVMLRQSH